jgi:hypothetical protein
MWQGVERKATFIAQLMRGKLDVREIEEIDSAALSAAEAKAISSGNPLLLEHSTIKHEVTRLRRLERAWQRNESMLAHTVRSTEDQMVLATNAIIGLEDALPKITDTSGDKFAMTIGRRFFDSRADAAHALHVWANDTSDLRWARAYTSKDYGAIAQISGFDVTVSVHPGLTGPMVQVGLATNTRHDSRGEPLPVPKAAFSMSRETFLEGGIGLVTRIENRVSGIPHLLDTATAERDSAMRAAGDAKARMGQPFKHAATLAAAEIELKRVDGLLAAMQRETATSITVETPEPAAPERPPLTVERLRADQTPPGIRTDPNRMALPAPFPVDQRRGPQTPPAPSI